MKSKATITTLATLGLATPLFAIERPTPAELPKEKAKNPIDMPVVENRAFLGIYGTLVPQALAEQHKLNGVGIQLRVVTQGSAAEKAGLKSGDILKNIEGKDIKHQEDVKKQLSNKKPGDKVKLSIISGNEHKEIEVELGKAPNRRQAQAIPLPNDALPGDNNFGANGLPQELLDQLPEAHRKKLEELMKNGLEQEFGAPDGLAPKMFKLPQQRLELNMQDLMGGNGGNFRSTTKMMDAEGSITLESDGDQQSVELHDTEGNLLFKGPYTTEEDKKKVPEKFRARIDRLGIAKMNLPDKGGNPAPLQELNPNDLLKEFKGLKELDNLGQMFQNQLNLQLNGGELKLNGKAIPLKGNMMKGGAFQLKMGPGGQMEMLPLNEGDNPFGDFGDIPMMGGNEAQTRDKDGLLKMRKTPEGKQVELYDKDGKLLFSGAYETEIDKASLPEEYRKRIEDSGIEDRLNMNNTFGGIFDGGAEILPQPVPAEPKENEEVPLIEILPVPEQSAPQQKKEATPNEKK